MWVAKLGPLNSWWVSGFGEGEKAVTGVSTEEAHYYLMEPPSHAYGKVIFPSVLEKAVLSEAVVKTLEKAHEEDAEINFDDFLYAIESFPVPDGCRSLSHQLLEAHADFILTQVNV